MKRIMLKSVKVSLILLIPILGINFLWLVYQEKASKSIDIKDMNPEANAYYRQQDNYIIYTSGNGVRTAPLIFGERLYLYSIDEDKSYLLQNTKGIFGAYMSDYAIEGERVYYQMGVPTGGGSVYYQYLDINSGSSSKEKFHSECSYAAKGDHFYGIEDNNIYTISLKSGKKETLIQGNQDEYENIVIKNNVLYAYNQEKNYFVSKALDTGEEDQYPFDSNDFPNGIELIDENHLVIVGAISGDLIEYDLKQKKQKTLVNLTERSPDDRPYEAYTCKFRDGYIYCNDDDINILAVNYKTGEKSKLINIADYLSSSFKDYNVDEAVVSYCTDYIAVDILYYTEGLFEDQERQHKYLLIFDYDGRLVKKKKLVPGLYF